MASFGNNLNNLRKKEGYSQEELANKLNVTRQTISKWELEQTTPDLKDLKNIANVFNISLNELVSENSLQNKKIKNNKIKLFCLIFAIIILVLVLFIFINRTYKILFIKNKIDTACNSNNFSIEKYIHTEKNFNQTLKEAYKFYFLDGKSILKKLNNENLSEVEMIEMLDEKEYYRINEIDKTYIQLPTEKYYENKMDLNYSPIEKDNILNEIYATFSISTKENLINLIFNFNFKVKNEFNRYYSVTNKINQIDSYVLLQASTDSNKFEYINSTKQSLDDGSLEIYSYMVELNHTENKNFELPNLSEYQKVDI